MIALNRIIGLFLAAAVALAAVTMASGRGQSGTELVICSGATVKVVVIGADGEPVEETRACPDHGLALFAAASAPAPDLPRRLARFAERVVPAAAAPAPRRVAGGMQARAPPVV
jgi:hypothetical protein